MAELEAIPVDPVNVRNLADTNRDVASRRMKALYDRDASASNLTVDSLVLWHVLEQGRGKAKKLNKRWKGPYKVVQVDPPCVVLADRNGSQKRIHLNHVKSIVSTAPLDVFRGRGRPRRGEV